MKTFKIFSIIAIALLTAQFSFAQKTTEKIPVSGNCGMCKSKIEKAAKTAGASSASWDMDAKLLTVTYNQASTNAGRIQKGVAAVGYDTRDVKATDEAYDKLHGCCKYDRTAAAKELSCDNPKCGKEENCCAGQDCCKDGKCEKHTTGKGGSHH